MVLAQYDSTTTVRRVSAFHMSLASVTRWREPSEAAGRGWQFGNNEVDRRILRYRHIHTGIELGEERIDEIRSRSENRLVNYHHIAGLYSDVGFFTITNFSQVCL